MWGGSLSSPVRGFLSTYKEQIKEVAFFVTQGGNFAREKVKQQMSEICGKAPRAFLAISEQDIRSGNLTPQVAAFVDQLDLKTPTLTTSPRKRPPETFAGF